MCGGRCREAACSWLRRPALRIGAGRLQQKAGRWAPLPPATRPRPLRPPSVQVRACRAPCTAALRGRSRAPEESTPLHSSPRRTRPWPWSAAPAPKLSPRHKRARRLYTAHDLAGERADRSSLPHVYGDAVGLFQRDDRVDTPLTELRMAEEDFVRAQCLRDVPERRFA